MKDAELQLQDFTEATEWVLRRPPRLMRWTLYLMLAGVGAAALWAYLTRWDITVKGSGVLRPRGEVVRLSAPVDAVLLRIDVQEGEQVDRGQLLLRLDDLRLGEELGAVEEQRVRVLAQRAELDLLSAWLREETLEGAGGVRPSCLHFRDKLAAFHRSLDVLRVEWTKTRARVERMEGLVAQGVVSHAEGDQLTLELEAARTRFDQERSRRLEGVEDLLRDLRNEERSVDREIERLREAVQHHRVVAPRAGVVTEVASLHEGEWVQAGSPLLALAPEGSSWIVEALLPDREAGEITPGLEAQLRFAALPHTKYGSIRGRVVSISPDAIAVPGVGETLRGYRVVIEMAGPAVPLRLGMSAEVRIIVARERVLGLLFRELQDRLRFD